MKILFLTRSLDRGGAERQLVALATGLFRRGHDVSVGVFYPNGGFQAELEDVGIKVVNLEKVARWDVFPFLKRLMDWVREERPDVIHGYLSFPNLLTVFLKPLVPGCRAVWGIRSTFTDLRQYDPLQRLINWGERNLATFADLIIANSHAGRDAAIRRGFPADKLSVVPNGIDSDRYAPDSVARSRLRAEWGVLEEEILIGLIGRLDPMKDHATFLKAAAQLSQRQPFVRFVCVGDGAKGHREALVSLCDELGLASRVIWAGLREDMPAVYNALDMLASSSIGEGFSNVIGEAMACGTPCVVTDVGDSAWIVGEHGIVVPPASPQLLYEGLMKGVEAVKNPAGSCAPALVRERILQNFSVERLLIATEEAIHRSMR